MRAGVDWLTATAQRQDGASYLYRLGTEMVKSQVAEGHKAIWVKERGYDVEKAGQATVGARHDGVIVECRGEYARTAYQAIALAPGVKATRIDLAVDVLHDPPITNVAEGAWNAQGKASRGTEAGVYKQLILATDGSQTCYFGAPTSERRARIYDKGAESPETFPKGTWRYELQLRGASADVALRGLVRRNGDVGSIAGTVRAYFVARGVEPWFPPGGDFLQLTPARPRTTDQATLAWLSSQIAPPVQRLLLRGYIDEVRIALGLADPPAPEPNLGDVQESQQHVTAARPTDWRSVDLGTRDSVYDDLDGR